MFLIILLPVTNFLDAQTGGYNPPMDTGGTGDPYYFQPKQPPDSLIWLRRNIPVEKVKALKKEDAFWYADKESAEKEKSSEPEKMKKPYIPLGQRTWFQTVLWMVIIGGFAVLLIWFLAGSQAGLFRNSRKIRVVPQNEDTITEDIFAIQYDTEIDRAARLGNYRLAIRLMYLRLLKEMTLKNIIVYKKDKTNSEYLFQLRPTSYYHDFFKLTRMYEYTWYGLFDIPGDGFQAIKKDFEQMQKKVFYR